MNRHCLVGDVQFVVYVLYFSVVDHVVRSKANTWKKCILYSDLYEFGTGFPGSMIATVAFTTWNNLMVLLVIIAINCHFAIKYPVQYNNWFTPRNTLTIMGLSLVLALLYSIVGF